MAFAQKSSIAPRYIKERVVKEKKEHEPEQVSSMSCKIILVILDS